MFFMTYAYCAAMGFLGASCESYSKVSGFVGQIGTRPPGGKAGTGGSQLIVALNDGAIDSACVAGKGVAKRLVADGVVGESVGHHRIDGVPLNIPVTRTRSAKAAMGIDVEEV